MLKPLKRSAFLPMLMLCLPAAPSLAAPPAAAPPADPPIPASEMSGIQLFRIGAEVKNMDSLPGDAEQARQGAEQKDHSKDQQGVVFEAKLVNRSRYRITSLKLVGQEYSGDHILSFPFTLSTREGKPLSLVPLDPLYLKSPLFKLPPGTYTGYYMVIESAYGVPLPPDASLPAQEQLLDAAEFGDIAALRILLDAHPELISTPAPQIGDSVRDDSLSGPDAYKNRQHQRQGMTPLHLAALSFQLPAVRLLLDRGAKVNARDSEDRTPLYQATVASNVQSVALLLAHRADPNIASWAGSPLFYAQNMRSSDPTGGPFSQIEAMLIKAGGKAIPGTVHQR